MIYLIIILILSLIAFTYVFLIRNLSNLSSVEKSFLIWEFIANVIGGGIAFSAFLIYRNVSFLFLILGPFLFFKSILFIKSPIAVFVPVYTYELNFKITRGGERIGIRILEMVIGLIFLWIGYFSYSNNLFSLPNF